MSSLVLHLSNSYRVFTFTDLRDTEWPVPAGNLADSLKSQKSQDVVMESDLVTTWIDDEEMDFSTVPVFGDGIGEATEPGIPEVEDTKEPQAEVSDPEPKPAIHQTANETSQPISLTEDRKETSVVEHPVVAHEIVSNSDDVGKNAREAVDHKTKFQPQILKHVKLDERQSITPSSSSDNHPISLTDPDHELLVADSSRLMRRTSQFSSHSARSNSRDSKKSAAPLKTFDQKLEERETTHVPWRRDQDVEASVDNIRNLNAVDARNYPQEHRSHDARGYSHTTEGRYQQNYSHNHNNAGHSIDNRGYNSTAEARGPPIVKDNRMYHGPEKVITILQHERRERLPMQDGSHFATAHDHLHARHDEEAFKKGGPIQSSDHYEIPKAKFKEILPHNAHISNQMDAIDSRVPVSKLLPQQLRDAEADHHLKNVKGSSSIKDFDAVMTNIRQMLSSAPATPATPDAAVDEDVDASKSQPQHSRRMSSEISKRTPERMNRKRTGEKEN
ncbi:hypothetical protein BC829DRAFT_27172 [Chytridium lagenaria]|nr:hypothetical protein BC829DRAFT_27172 [Chytridium lagenaria]